MKNNESSNKSSFGRIFTRSVMLVINVIIIALMLLSVMANYLSPAKYSTLFAFLALLFPLWVMLNIICVSLWMIARRWYFLLSLAAMLISLPSIKNTFSFHSELPLWPADEDSLTLMTYNVAAFDKYDKHTPTLEYIRRQDADVVCLQEFAVSDRNDYITQSEVLKTLSAYPYHYFTFTVERSGRHFGIATFSKYPIVDADRLEIPSMGNAVHYCDILAGTDTLRVVNCHLESFSFSANDLNSLDQAHTNPNSESFRQAGKTMQTRMAPRFRTRAKQADIIAASLAGRTTKTIVCGDFNDTPVSYTYHTIRGDRLDAHVEAEWGPGYTYYHRGMGVRIDQILHSRDLHLVDFRTLRSGASDHYPLRATLSW